MSSYVLYYRVPVVYSVYVEVEAKSLEAAKKEAGQRIEAGAWLGAGAFLKEQGRAEITDWDLKLGVRD